MAAAVIGRAFFRTASATSHPRLLFTRGPLALAHAFGCFPPPYTGSCFTQTRCWANDSCDSYSLLNSCSNFGDPLQKMAPLFCCSDAEHWLIVMDKPGGEGATKNQMMCCYLQTLAKVVGSEEEAMNKIYKVSCERYFGFGCEIDEETSNKLKGLPGVLTVLPDPEYAYSRGKDCQFIPRLNLGGELSQIIEDLNLLYKVVDQLEIAITKVGDDKDKDLKTRTEGKSS